MLKGSTGIIPILQASVEGWNNMNYTHDEQLNIIIACNKSDIRLPRIGEGSRFI